MTSKLSRYCEGIMEAAWLVAVIVVPVFFNVYSSRIFEPDKITLLRTLALLILAAWSLKLINEGGIRWEGLGSAKRNPLKIVTDIPLILPVILLALVYLIATVFSIAPRTSLFGSYQRLQGTYTFFSYIVVFAAMVGNIRKKAQIDRLITTMIVASLPIGLYGILQRYDIDPIPWGGNVQQRIAANMGNSIFVAAYLIVVFPLSVGRILQSFRNILRSEVTTASSIAGASAYIFVGAIQLIGIYLSGSRGPLLGLLAGAFFIFILISLMWKKRQLLITTIGLAVVIGGFLLFLNIPNGPLEGIRTAPWVGRFGQLLDFDQRTSRVRSLIWQGAAELVGLHDPIQFPNGSQDTINVLRPIIGYGPESMYVSYNPFFPPELARVEKRNASPDRSHNETWDALVVTGFLGLVVYMLVFLAIFYFGLKWLGLIADRKQRLIFLAFSLGGGAAGAIGLMIWQGIGFFGVGLPFGIVIGFIGYITYAALFGKQGDEQANLEEYSLLMVVLLGGILAHFVEIHFGIAIAATRTYFWIYTALLLTIGAILPKYGGLVSDQPASLQIGSETMEAEISAGSRSRRKKSRRTEKRAMAMSNEWSQILIGSIIISVVLITLGFNFISNLTRSTSGTEVFMNSLTRLQNKDDAVSYGILAMVLTTWLIASILFTSDPENGGGKKNWISRLGIAAGVSLFIALFYWLMQAGNLARLARVAPTNQEQVLQQIGEFGGLLTGFYIVLFLLILALAGLLFDQWPIKFANKTGISLLIAPVLLSAVMGLGYLTNLRVIHADITFKMADPFTNGEQWPVAVLIYREAIREAPNEDHYYLFLGRAYLEYAKTLQDPKEREALMLQAEADLIKAQKLNPLNTDHTANLARLYSWWASVSSRTEDKQEYAERSEVYYQKALTLSPNNAVLWSEKAILELNLLRKPEQALITIEDALRVDPEYDRSYALLGDFYVQQGRKAEDETAKNEAFEMAVVQYQNALKQLSPAKSNNQTRYTYHVALAGVYLELKETSQAIEQYQEAAKIAPRQDKWRIYETLARLYAQAGEKQFSLDQMELAIQSAPESELERLQELLVQIQNLQQ